VREESHLDDMRDAIRGDFERLAERRGEQQLLRVTEPDEPGASEPAPEPTPEPEPGPEAIDEPEAPRRSWLSRLFSSL
jgi:hypothetical protein